MLAEGSYMAGTLRSIGAPPDRVRVVHLGVDPSAFPFRGRTPSESVVGLISGSFPELARKLDTLLRDPSRWPAMGRAGRAHIEAEFDIREQVRKMESVYREIL